MPDVENEYHERCLGLIETHGWMAQAVFPGNEEPDDTPSFTYSVGAFKNYGIPELIVFSLPQEVRHSLLTMYIETSKEGKTVEVNRRLSGWLENYDVVLIDIAGPKSAEYFGTASWFNETDDFPARQLIWPTTQSRAYPWDVEWPLNAAWRQPVLGKIPPLPLESALPNGSATQT